MCSITLGVNRITYRPGGMEDEDNEVMREVGKNIKNRLKCEKVK